MFRIYFSLFIIFSSCTLGGSSHSLTGVSVYPTYGLTDKPVILHQIKQNNALILSRFDYKRPQLRPANLLFDNSNNIIQLYGKPLTRVRVNKMSYIIGDYEWGCLSEALYFEARGESLIGILAVAEVIINRRDSKAFPNTICAVVNQGSGKRHQCQFSYKCDGLYEVFKEPEAYQFVGKIAHIALNYHKIILTNGALYFHNKQVRPYWSNKLALTAQFGNHYFYRHPI